MKVPPPTRGDADMFRKWDTARSFGDLAAASGRGVYGDLVQSFHAHGCLDG